jgi:hypothetical protein
VTRGGVKGGYGYDDSKVPQTSPKTTFMSEKHVVDGSCPRKSKETIHPDCHIKIVVLKRNWRQDRFMEEWLSSG